MKALLISFLLLFSYSLNAQAITCVTSEVESNYSCSGSWVPDIEVCWTYTASPPPYYCFINIENNSTTGEHIIVNLTSQGGSYSNVTINAQSNYTFRVSSMDGTVSLNFSSSAHESTCASYFELSCF
jgi:hypothetical protein